MDRSQMAAEQSVLTTGMPGQPGMARHSRSVGSRVATLRENCLVCRQCGGIDLATSSDPIEPVFLTVNGKPLLVRQSTCVACYQARKSEKHATRDP